jgi:phosphoglucosamine mutase
MKNLFGTDGIRGPANIYPMLPEVIMKIAMIAGSITPSHGGIRRALIGKDTRMSGYMFENAIAAGLISVGFDVFFVGPIPTPAVSFLTRSLRCDLGIMISASHNEYIDNGIKFFDKNGEKLSMETQKIIEDKFFEDIEIPRSKDNIGVATRIDDAVGRYVEFIKRTFPHDQDLSDMKIVIDAANGSAYKIAREILWELGADVVSIGDKPDGRNINKDCGSTKTDLLIKTVVEVGANIGIALDGDADRVIIVDENGSVVNGDQIIANIALEMKESGKLNNDTVAITHQSNSALDAFLLQNNIKTIRTDIGDKYVYRAMVENNLSLGGEESGHIVLKKYATSGDGMLIALRVLSIIKQRNKLGSSLNLFKNRPDIKSKFPYQRDITKQDIDSISSLQSEINDKLGTSGRSLIRKSGTEKIIRILIEHDDLSILDQNMKLIKDRLSTILT